MGKAPSRINQEEATALYRAGFSFSEIAKRFDVSRQAVHHLLIRTGVHVPIKHRRITQMPPEYFQELRERAERDFIRLREIRRRIESIQSRVRLLVAKAITNGVLVPQPCEVCKTRKPLANGNRGIHAHHYDYSKPLEVMWLCSKHHQQWHSKNTPSYGTFRLEPEINPRFSLKNFFSAK